MTELLARWADEEGAIADECVAQSALDENVDFMVTGLLPSLTYYHSRTRGRRVAANAARAPAPAESSPSAGAPQVTHCSPAVSVGDELDRALADLSKVMESEALSAAAQMQLGDVRSRLRRVRGHIAGHSRRDVRWGDENRTVYSWAYKLDAILFADKLKGHRGAAAALEHASRLIMHPSLQASVIAPPVPSQSVMCRDAVDMDIACMLYAREYVFNVHDVALPPRTERLLTVGDLNGHLRADSSPQFGKDLFVIELDLHRVPAGDGGSSAGLAVSFWQSVAIQKRLLVLQQIGVRAGRFHHKLKKLLHSMSLEAGGNAAQLDYVRRAIASILFDCGIESKFAIAPMVGASKVQKLGASDDDCHNDLIDVTATAAAYPNALPIPDHDHGMHHTMEEVRGYFDFDDTLLEPTKAAAKFFSHSGRMTMFLAVTVLSNATLDQEEKDMYRKMFSTLCPTWVDHRWQYMHDVFQWLLGRMSAILILWRSSIQRIMQHRPDQHNNNPNNSAQSKQLCAVLRSVIWVAVLCPHRLFVCCVEWEVAANNRPEGSS